MKQINSFNENIYSLLKKVPKGKVTTYKALAEKLDTKAYRAVGQALKNNNHPNKIPCYKAIKQDGSIGGYCGSNQKNIRKKIRKLKSDGIVVKNNKIDLSQYLHTFSK